MRKPPIVNLIIDGRNRKSFKEFVTDVISDTFVSEWTPTRISIGDYGEPYFVLYLGPVDNSSPVDGDFSDYGDIKGYRFVQEDLTVSSLKNYITVYLFGIKQEDNSYYVEAFDSSGTKLSNETGIASCVEIRIIFTESITRVPSEVLRTDFKIKGKILEIK